MSSNQPLAKYGKDVRVTVWRARNGSCSFSIEKQYKDKTSNEWKKSSVWFLKDLETLLPFLKEAIKYGQEHDAEQKSWGQPAKEEW